MNAGAPGWLPDPSGRHEYRYWDGTNWTDDVSDGGVTAFDPLQGGPGGPVGGPVGAPMQQGYGADPYGTGGYGSGGYAPQLPPKSGPSTGLLVGVGLVALALVVGVLVLVSQKDDKKDDAETTSNSNTTEQGDDTTDTTESDDSGGTEDGEFVVDAIATGLVEQSDGLLTQEEGECLAQAMVDELGTERLVDLGLDSEASSDPLGGLTEAELGPLVTAFLDCVPADKLVEMGGVEP